MSVIPFLQDNLTALAKIGSPVVKWLESHAVSPEVVAGHLLRNSKGNLDYAPEQGPSLYGAMPPGMVYRGWAPADDGRLAAGATIIIGSGLGYGINTVLTNTPNTHKALVVEPSPELLVACLGLTDYRPFINAKKLIFLPPDKAAFETALKTLDVCFLFGKIHLRADMACKQHGPQYAQWTEHVRARLENTSVELSTLRQKQDVMVGNELKNYHQAMLDGSLLGLRGMARGVAAVIMGAGPSLARFAPELSRRRGHALYTTALQTLPALEGMGFKPDLCMAIDFRPEMRTSIDNLKDKSFAADIPLIYSTKMGPDVLALYPGPKLPMWTVGGIATYVLANQELVMDGGGNVAVALCRFLIACGVGSILLVGQDFSWSGDTTHVSGHHASTTRHAYDPKRHMALKNSHGETIYTNVGYMAAKRDMEKSLGEGHIPVYNLYGGGVPISSAENVTLEQAHLSGALASAPGSLEWFRNALERSRTPRARPIFSARAPKWSTSLKNVAGRIEKLFKNPGKNAVEIRVMFERVRFFLRQDPLYMPYLYNEIMDMAGLCHARVTYGIKDMVEFRRIRKRVLEKVREMDQVLCSSREWRAA